MKLFSVKSLRFFLTVVAALVLVFSSAGKVLAAGNIDAVQKYSQFLNIDLDSNGTNDFVDWDPAFGGATVSDTGISGYIWGETVGWINLSPTNDPVTLTCPASSGGPAYLGGYAWGQNTGWINFSPTNATGANKPQINSSTGQISGDVWSQNYGWIQLSSPQTPLGSSYNPSLGLVTSWRGCTVTPPGGGGGGGPSGGCALPQVMINGVCTLPPTTTPVSGCTNPAAVNYNSSATVNDGSCYFPINSNPTPPVNPTTPPINVTPTTPTPPGGGGGVPPVAPGNAPGSSPIQVSPGGPIGISSLTTLTGINGFLGELPTSWKWILPLIGILGLLGSLPGLITRLSNLLLGFFFGRKKQRGIVYDSVTKEPIDPAIVSVIDIITGKEILNQITDVHGRYGFILKKGSYKMIVRKTHFQFPSVKLAGKTKDEVYDHLYFGEVFTIENEEDVVTMNIPMDPLATDWNQEVKRKKRKGVLQFLIKSQAFMWIAEILFVIGFVVSLIIAHYYPNWWNILMVALYVIIGIFQFSGFGPVSFGRIKKNNSPLPYGIVRVYNANLNREIAHTVTSDRGDYYVLVPKGHYYVTVDSKNDDGTHTNVFTSGVINANRGLVNRSFDI